MILEASHRTLYRYSTPVMQSQHVIHMSPRSVSQQTVRHHSLITEPAPATRYEGFDAFGNPVVILSIERPHEEFVLFARSTVETQTAPEADLAASAPWDALDGHVVNTNGAIDLDVVQYRCASRVTMPSREVAAYARRSFAPGRPVLDAAMELIRRIYEDFTFDATATDVSTPIEFVFEKKRGVCQDFAHIALAALRSHRVPARYVSGYILTKPPEGQRRLAGADASHAWISVWSPEAGWVDFDPTNGVRVGGEHITIAHGRDYDDVSPISGVLIGGGEHTVSVGVDVVALA